jgi:phospholipid N-methyltransferase
MNTHCRLTCVEVDEEFVEACSAIDDDRLTVCHACATDLVTVLQDGGVTEVDYIVSSVPLSILDDHIADRILAAAQASLRPGGRFLQYQYSLTYLRKLTDRYGDVRLGFTLRNVPPAFVYECIN